MKGVLRINLNNAERKIYGISCTKNLTTFGDTSRGFPIFLVEKKSKTGHYDYGLIYLITLLWLIYKV